MFSALMPKPSKELYPSRLQKQPGMNGVLLSFLLGMAVSAAIFVPFLVVDQGFFIYCGDFNSQQIPFYYYVQQFIRTGGGTWSWATDLGSSVVNSYSFYNIGSPFLWLTVLFPSRIVPYLMVPLFLLKFGGISAAACLWLSRYAKTRNMAVVCSLIYAFCGTNVYNIFFNHMLDSAVIFPLMLWAMDGYVHDNRRGLFALFVGLSLLCNYFFFLGNVTFCLIYFFVKLACREYRISLKNLGLLVFEAVLGVGIGMALALPAFYNLIANPRIDNFTNGFGLVLYGRVQQYFAILSSMFLPPDPPYLPNIFTDAAVKWTSMSLFLPVVGMAGVFAYFRARKGGSVKWVLGICLVMALVPILNSSFYAFNASYYARWYYMPLLIAALATMRSLEDADIDLVFGIKLAAAITAGFAIFGLLPTEDDEGWHLGVAEEPVKLWLTLLTALFALAICYVLVRHYKGKVRFGPIMLAAVMGFSVLYSVIHLSLGKFEQWERDASYREQQYVGLNELDLPEDEGFFRIDAYGCHDNVGLWSGYSCLQTFNSVVTPSIMEFYPLVGVKRDVSSKPETKEYALRGLLSCRYTVMPTEEVDNFLTDSATMGWRFYKTSGPFTIYENENFVPLGFTYNEYVTMENLEGIKVEDRSPILMRAIGLDAEQEGRYRQYFSGQAVSWELPQETPLPDGASGDAESTGGWHEYDTVDFAHYLDDCDARRAAASYQNWHDASGFGCRIEMDKDNLVFFGVPYDPGFTATVNGVEAEVLKVSGGMMAVEAPAGDNTIEFSYRTPGFAMGVVITLVSLALLAGYLVCAAVYRRRVAAVVQAAAETAETPPAGRLLPEEEPEQKEEKKEENEG